MDFLTTAASKGPYNEKAKFNITEWAEYEKCSLLQCALNKVRSILIKDKEHVNKL